MFISQTAEVSCPRGSSETHSHARANMASEECIRATAGTVFNIMRYSTHDGPGIRTTVFLKGCPLRCHWCQNPEGQSPRLELFFRAERCIRCGDCSRFCSHSAILLNEGIPITLTDKCRLCGDCVKVCQSTAREMTGKNATIAEIMEEIEKDTVFYDDSGGGVTFSGGEPLMQPAFLHGLLKLCKERKIHTAVETCGFTRSGILLRIGAYVDLFLYDLKVVDSPIHEKFTGVSNGVILENLKTLSRHHAHVVVRFPLIPGANDDEENISQTARFVSSLTNVQEVHILPYHQGGIAKYTGLGRTYELLEVKAPSSEQISQTVDRFVRFGLKVKIGG